MADGILVLEDGAFYRGKLFTPDLECGGEVVFNTSPTGYQEILTDPSYVGQIVVLTTSHVGNYGVNAEDIESLTTRVSGLIVRDYHPVPSNWRSDRSLQEYLVEAHVPGLTAVDTRALVLHIRQAGALRGIVRALPVPCASLPLAGCVRLPNTEVSIASSHMCVVRSEQVLELVRQVHEVPRMAGLDLASRVTCLRASTAGDPKAPLHVVALDFGIKENILRQLLDAGCRVTQVPASTSAQAVLDLCPDGILLSNGPGDPAPLQAAIATIQQLLGKVPIFGICLGHQLLGLACGGTTYKMTFGHRGANHPVRDLDTGRVEITSQNHGFAVHASSLDGRQIAITHINLNDDSVEGLRHRRYPAFSVQFHPEASPGPHDSHHLFHRFVEMMEKKR